MNYTCEQSGCGNTFVRAWRTSRKRFCSKQCHSRFWNSKQGPTFQTRRYQKWREKTSIAGRLWQAAKERARGKGWKFNISIDDVRVPNVCPVLGIKLVSHVGRAAWDSTSIDRIDSSKGYERGNIRVISNRANALKTNASLTELKLILADAQRLADSASGEDFRTVDIPKPTGEN